MIIQKNNDYYNKEYTNDISDYNFNSTFLKNETIDLNDMKLQSEIDIDLPADSLGLSKLQLKIPLLSIEF